MKRLLTGLVYILVILEFVLLRYIHILFFDLLVVLFSALGTYEMLRAFGGKIEKAQKIVAAMFSVLLIAAYAVSDVVFKQMQNGVNYAPHIAFVVFMAGLALMFGMLVFRHEKTTLESTGYAAMCMLYPSVFLLVLAGCNHMPVYSEIGIVFVFVICPFADCFAYVFGKLFGKKFPKKMSPHVSPNKTVVGGIGGILGGAIGAAIVFFVYYGLISDEIALTAMNAAFFIGLGILTAGFTEFGDLVESAIKRRLGVKDMGNLLPGHGGVLDRIDSTLYACLIVCFVIVIRIMTTGVAA